MSLACPLKGPWSEAEAGRFLDQERSPVRLAINDRRGYPLIVSLWYRFDGEVLWCATHESSRLARRLRDDPRVAFEISVNDPPYRGLRGQADVTLLAERGRDELAALMARYAVAQDSRLGRWLLSRADGELALRLQPRWLSAWDYGDRMRDAGGASRAPR